MYVYIYIYIYIYIYGSRTHCFTGIALELDRANTGPRTGRPRCRAEPAVEPRRIVSATALRDPGGGYIHIFMYICIYIYVHIYIYIYIDK